MRKVIFAAIAIALSSSLAFAQDKKEEIKEEPPIKLTEAQISAAKKAITALKSDAGRLKTYCEMLSIGAQADEAFDKKDEKKAEELGQKAEKLSEKLGEDFNNAMISISQADPEDKSSEELFKIVDELDESCSKK